ncbi:MAG: oligosaccharide flippase family protein [Sphingomonas oligoaromativorans]
MATALPVPIWRRALGSGIGLIAMTMFASNGMRIVSTIVLTRILAPSDYGVVGVTSAILMVMFMISDFGFGVYIVQHPQGDDPRRLDAIWTIRLFRSILLFVALLALSQPIAMLLEKPEMGIIIASTSFQFLLDGGSSLASYTAVREQKLGRLSTLDVIASIAQTLFGIILAILLRNFWAILIANLLGGLLRAVLSYAMFEGSRRSFFYDRVEAAALWRFGKTVASAHTLQIMLSNVDKFVLSRLFPLGTFGLYSLASNLAGAPSMFTSLYPNRVLLPTYAATARERPEQLADEYYRTRRLTMIGYLLAMGGFVGMAPAIVHLLYDTRYSEAAIFLRILALAPAVALNNYAAREVLIVVGRVKTLFYANIVRMIWLAVAGSTGFAMFGPMGLIVTVGLIEVPVMFYCWFALAQSRLFRLNEELLMLAALGAGIGLGLLCNNLYFAFAAHLRQMLLAAMPHIGHHPLH